MDQPILLVQGEQNWLHVEQAALNTVAQVFAQVGRFNWLEPYKVESQYESRGTGFFINDQGYLVTNAHVVNEAKTIWINIPSLGRKMIRVEVVGFCPDRDLALLRVTSKDLERIQKRLGRIPFLMFGDSDVVKRTDKVLVLGYPLGQHRLKSTTGVVSGREAANSISYIQITAPINPGSSGGPLISTQGTVIGVTVAIAARAFNVGYAIPINELKIIFEDLLENSLVRKPILGGHFHNTTDNHARFLGNPIPAGLYVHKVFKGSLLEKAGVFPGDMIYELNGHKLDSHGEATVPWSSEKISLYDLISRLPVGKEIHLVLYRSGKKKDIRFILDDSVLFPIRVKYPDYEKIEHEVLGGMVVMELAHNHLPLLEPHVPSLVKFREMENMLDPVLLITHILPGSQAQQLRCLIPGDIIAEVNGKKVKTIDQFREALRSGASSDFLSVKTANDVLAVFQLKKMLADEERLSSDFAYPLTPVVKELIDMVKNDE
jgi:serine protease Do